MKNLYAVLDVVSDMIVGGVMQFAGHAAATRQFSDLVLDQNSFIGKHPKDYQLLWLGGLDLASGLVTVPSEGPECIVTGAQCAAMQAETD